MDSSSRLKLLSRASKTVRCGIVSRPILSIDVIMFPRRSKQTRLVYRTKLRSPTIKPLRFRRFTSPSVMPSGVLQNNAMASDVCLISCASPPPKAQASSLSLTVSSLSIYRNLQSCFRVLWIWLIKDIRIFFSVFLTLSSTILLSSAKIDFLAIFLGWRIGFPLIANATSPVILLIKVPNSSKESEILLFWRSKCFRRPKYSKPIPETVVNSFEARLRTLRWTILLTSINLLCKRIEWDWIRDTPSVKSILAS